jgi:hypothetical protein
MALLTHILPSFASPGQSARLQAESNDYGRRVSREEAHEQFAGEEKVLSLANRKQFSQAAALDSAMRTGETGRVSEENARWALHIQEDFAEEAKLRARARLDMTDGADFSPQTVEEPLAFQAMHILLDLMSKARRAQEEHLGSLLAAAGGRDVKFSLFPCAIPLAKLSACGFRPDGTQRPHALKLGCTEL